MKIGVLGAGQLGRMLAIAGLPLGMSFTFYDISGKPTVGIGDVIIDTDSSHQELTTFLNNTDVVTYEFEHLPTALTHAIEQSAQLRPSSRAISICQNRAEEKALFSSINIPTAAYRLVNSATALKSAAAELGCPVVAKSVTEGYDGKGQAILKTPEDAASAWQSIGHDHLLVESFVNFEREISIIAARSASGEISCYPITENDHHNGILRYSFAPAPAIKPEIQQEAEQLIRMLLNELNYIGVLTLELFETQQGLLANEMAPRVHNSGHWTIEGTVCSQFENHLRAIADLPLGDPQAKSPTCMINIIGQLGNIEDLLRLPYANLHLYDKEERPGRKIGHVTIQAETYEELLLRVENCASLLPGCPKHRISIS